MTVNYGSKYRKKLINSYYGVKDKLSRQMMTDRNYVSLNNYTYVIPNNNRLHEVLVTEKGKKLGGVGTSSNLVPTKATPVKVSGVIKTPKKVKKTSDKSPVVHEKVKKIESDALKSKYEKKKASQVGPKPTKEKTIVRQTMDHMKEAVIDANPEIVFL